MKVIRNPESITDEVLKEVYNKVYRFLESKNLKVAQVQVGVNSLLSPERSILVILENELPTEETINLWNSLKRIVGKEAEVFLV